MQQDIFGYVMPLAPVLHDAHGIISGTITFLRSRLSKCGATWLFGYVTSLVPAHDSNGVNPWHHCLFYIKTIKVRCNTIFWLCDATGIGIIWQHWQCQWHMALMPALVLTPASNLNKTNAMMSFMAPSANHVIAMYMTQTNMPLDAANKPHMPISLCPHMIFLCQHIYTSFEHTAINKCEQESGIHTFYTFGICH